MEQTGYPSTVSAVTTLMPLQDSLRLLPKLPKSEWSSVAAALPATASMSREAGPRASRCTATLSIKRRAPPRLHFDAGLIESSPGPLDDTGAASEVSIRMGLYPERVSASKKANRLQAKHAVGRPPTRISNRLCWRGHACRTSDMTMLVH